MLSGIALSKGQLMGNGMLALHHYFIWPAFGLLIGLAVWRLMMRERASHRAFGIYLILATISMGAMLGGGYWGGQMLVGK